MVHAIAWTSPIRRKGAIQLVTGLLAQAVKDELILRSPANSILPTRVVKREIDPFSREEADDLIANLYKVASGLQSIHACFLSIQECVLTRRWPRAGTRLIRSKRAKVCRIRLYGKIKERTKTKVSRKVLLNEQALQALEKARPLTAARSDMFSRRKDRVQDQSYTFDPKPGLSAIGWQRCVSRESDIAGCTTPGTPTRRCV